LFENVLKNKKECHIFFLQIKKIVWSSTLFYLIKKIRFIELLSLIFCNLADNCIKSSIEDLY